MTLLKKTTSIGPIHAAETGRGPGRVMAQVPQPTIPHLPSKFLRVEEFFADYQEWPTVAEIRSANLDASKKALDLQLATSGGHVFGAVVQFLRKDVIRIRANPHKPAGGLSPQNTRGVVMDTMDELQRILAEEEPFTLEKAPAADGVVELLTKDVKGKPCVRLRIEKSPLRVTLYSAEHTPEIQIWQTALPAFRYAPNGNDDYYSILSVNKPATAKYIGFGEQGGRALCKNSAQTNYFNFDNMRYRQVYNRGPLEGREPLYHSDPFFMEFNGNPETDCMYGLYVDNASQTFVDVGYLNTSRYMIGTSFGDLDIYLIVGHSGGEILEDFTAVVGRSRLKPRYALGYHQGCYGYETRADVEWAVDQYRRYQIPLDGVHIDVDIQHNYQTFTVDEGRFPDPKGMFAALRARGVKCSTNITPIISSRDPNYQTYKEGLEKGYFVADRRHPNEPGAWRYQDYGGGYEYFQDFHDPEGHFNTGKPYVGEVYYGGDRGTPGHYADLGKSEVRKWWGQQYQYLYDLGLEMVWQDMTTPSIRSTRGDMRGFPFCLLISDDFLSDQPPRLSRAIKVWNLYSYNLHKATYHGLNNLAGRENKRNFIVGRGSFTGMHRYAALWTGDNASSWDFLRMNVAQVISLGMSGLPICGQDIGGFESENSWEHWADPELLIRWTVAGAFLPWFRNHYIRKGQKYFQEPFQYQTVDVSKVNPPEARDFYGMVLPICRHYIELRYRLLQVFYDAMFRNTLDGMPICRPMFLNDPRDKALYNDKIENLDDQFFVGPDLLVAPILEPQSVLTGFGKRDVYLPAYSDWYGFVDNRMPLGPAIEGGATVRDYDARLDARGDHIAFIIPLYVRAGAILPMLELEQFVGERNSHSLPNPITLNIYPGQRGQYTMYLDDGVSRSSAPKKPADQGGDPSSNDEYRQTEISHEYVGKNARKVTVRRVNDGYAPLEKYFFVAILHDPMEERGPNGPIAKLVVAGEALGPVEGGPPGQRADELASANRNSWYYNENINITFIKVFDKATEITIELTYV
jgi:alpha-glucosidase